MSHVGSRIGSAIGIGINNLFQILNADMVEHAREWILVSTTTCTKQPDTVPINYSLHIVHNFAFEHHGAVLHMRNMRFDAACAAKFAQIRAMSTLCDKSIVRCQILVRTDDNQSLHALTADLRNMTHAFTIVSWSVLLHKENFSAAMASGSPFEGLAQFTSSVVHLHRCEQTRVGHAKKYFSSELMDCDDLCSPDAATWKLGLRLHQTQSLMWMQQLEDRVATGRNFISVPRWLPLVGTAYVVLLDSCIIIHQDAFARIGLTHRSSVLQKIKYRGGILADETGSGKTSVVLALIVATRDKVDIGKEGVNTHKNMSVQDTLACIPVKATLVIVPMNLCAQWVSELAKFVDARVNYLCVYNKRQYASTTIEKIMATDIVFTTAEFLSGKAYPTAYKNTDFYVMNRLAGKAHGGGFESTDPVVFRAFLWKRVIFDEQHAFPVVSGIALRSIKGIKAQVYWGITATPSSNTMNHVLQVTNEELPNVDASMLVNQCIRRSAFAHELEPFVVQTHWVDIQPREREILNTYRHDGLPHLIQLCTCFNVLALFGSDGNMSVRADEIQVCMTFDELSRMMVTRRVSEIKSHMPEIETLQRTITVDKNLLEHIQGTEVSDGAEEHKDQEQRTDEDQQQERADDQEEGGVDAGTTGQGDTADDSSIVRVIKRRVKVNERKFKQLNDRLQSLIKQCTFFQDQIEMAADQRICPICLVNTPNVITQCGHWFCKECMLTYTNQKSVTPCPMCKLQLRQRDWIQKVEQTVGDESSTRAVVVAEAKPPVTDADKYGSKLAAIVELLRRIKESGERAIMFVQWTDLLRTLRAILSTGGVKVVAIIGNTSSRNAAIQKLKTGEVDVLLLSMDISTTGLNLTDANHVIFAHALVGGSPSTQTHSIKQAVARVYRIGQMRRVFIHWFITKNTDEEHLFLANSHQQQQQ